MAWPTHLGVDAREELRIKWGSRPTVGTQKGNFCGDICLTGWHPLNLVSNLDQYLCLLDITSRVSCCSGAPSRCHYLGHFLQWQLKVSAVLENLVVNISECDAMFMCSDRKTFSCSCWLMLQWNLPIITTTSLLGCGIFFIYFFFISSQFIMCFQCFNTVAWASGRATGL